MQTESAAPLLLSQACLNSGPPSLYASCLPGAIYLVFLVQRSAGSAPHATALWLTVKEVIL